MHLNPIVVRELRSYWRGWQAFTLILIFSLLMSAVIGCSYWLGAEDEARYRLFNHNSSHIGHTMFTTVTWLQVFLWMILAPGLTATSIAWERERGLLEAVQLSQMSAWRILFGKLGSALAAIVLVMLIPLPAIAICFYMGGVSPQEYLLAALLEVSTAITCATIGICCSAWSRRSAGALSATFAFVILWGIGSMIAWGIGAALLAEPNTFWHPIAHLLVFFGHTNPVYAAVVMVQITPMQGSFMSGTLGISLSDWCLTLIFQAVLVPLLLLLAMRALRRPFAPAEWQGATKRRPVRPPVETTWPGQVASELAQAADASAPMPISESKSGPRVAPGWWRFLVHLIPDGNPMLRRELLSRFRRRRQPPAAIVVQSFLLLAIGYGYVRVLFEIWTDPNNRSVLWMMIFVIGVVITLLTMTVAGAGTMAREREAGTIEALRLTLLSPAQIVVGKIGASFIAQSIYWVLLLPLLIPCIRFNLYAPEGYSNSISLVQVALTFGILWSSMWYCQCLGIFVSWRSRRVQTAVGWSVALQFALLLFVPIVLASLESLGGYQSPLRGWGDTMQIVHPVVAMVAAVSDDHRLPRYTSLLGHIALIWTLGTLLLGATLASMGRRDWSLTKSRR